MIRFEDVSLDYTGFQMIIPGIKNATLTFGSAGFVNIYEEGYLKRNALTDLLAAIRKPDSGEIYVQGIRLSELDEVGAADYRSKYVTALFRNFQFLEDKTVLENISFYYELRGFNRSSAHEETIELLKKLNFEDRGSSYPTGLNEYDRPLFFIALAFAIDRPITVMDGIDYKFNQNTIRALMEFSKRHLIIIKSLKDSGLKEVCHRFITIIDGVIKSDTGGTDYSMDASEIAIIGKKLKVSFRTYQSGAMSAKKLIPLLFAPLFSFMFFSGFFSRWVSALFYSSQSNDPLDPVFAEFLKMERLSNIFFALIAVVFILFTVFRMTLKQIHEDSSFIAKLRLAGIKPNNIVKVYLTTLMIPATIFMSISYALIVFFPLFNLNWIAVDFEYVFTGTFLSVWVSGVVGVFVGFFATVFYQAFLLKRYLSEKLAKFMVNLNKPKKQA